jgi:hypothetical protein
MAIAKKAQAKASGTFSFPVAVKREGESITFFSYSANLL